MILFKDTTNRGRTLYKCDRCSLELRRDTNNIYSIYIKTPNDKTPIKKWDLCERDYRALCRGIEKNNK